jgi:transcriptional antiterminator
MVVNCLFALTERTVKREISNLNPLLSEQRDKDSWYAYAQGDASQTKMTTTYRIGYILFFHSKICYFSCKSLTCIKTAIFGLIPFYPDTGEL